MLWSRGRAMDVRCDRCQTEYELDDDAVAGAGASVQCTTCGHTFVVSRMPQIELRTTPAAGVPPTAQPAPAPETNEPRARRATPPPVPEWVLATESGQTHRLRDLTTLQKWIVERRVSRADRVSNRGGAWRVLGEVEELRPFFDVVEQADRQSAPAQPVVSEPPRGPRSATMPATPRGLQSAASRGQISATLADDDTFSMREGRRSRLDDRPFPDTIPPDEDLSLLVKPKRTGLKVVGGVVFLGLAAGAWYLGFREPHGFKITSTGGAPVTPPAPAPAPAPPPAP
ncbi:MAG TPA: zinc-ribbon domain-containing protein, partial [Polyangia bacterium]|nr:zinc-ribbon domain-containing protein [Polyangia bacterium]